MSLHATARAWWPSLPVSLALGINVVSIGLAKEVRAKKIVFVFLLFTLLTSCGSLQGKKNECKLLERGTNLEQLNNIMGAPEGNKKVGDYEVYSYYNRYTGWLFGRSDCHYIFKEGILVSHGSGKIRQNQSTGAVYTVPNK